MVTGPVRVVRMVVIVGMAGMARRRGPMIVVMIVVVVVGMAGMVVRHGPMSHPAAL